MDLKVFIDKLVFYTGLEAGREKTVLDNTQPCCGHLRRECAFDVHEDMVVPGGPGTVLRAMSRTRSDRPVRGAEIVNRMSG